MVPETAGRMSCSDSYIAALWKMNLAFRPARWEDERIACMFSAVGAARDSRSSSATTAATTMTAVNSNSDNKDGNDNNSNRNNNERDRK